MVDAWQFAPHCCRACLGRVMQCQDIFRCADCGAEASGKSEAICGCGLLPGPLAARMGHVGGTVRCGPNPRRGPASPAEIVILFGDAPAPKAAAA